ncbi:MAG: hypothetical protein LBB18_03640 [Puniceicoccales bacterium]|nr:hypothetical protein [Puniceicoccales bacterium]
MLENLYLDSGTYERDQYGQPQLHMRINGHDAYVYIDCENFYMEYGVVPLYSKDPGWSWDSVLPQIEVNRIGGYSCTMVSSKVRGCTNDPVILKVTNRFFRDATSRYYEVGKAVTAGVERGS